MKHREDCKIQKPWLWAHPSGLTLTMEMCLVQLHQRMSVYLTSHHHSGAEHPDHTRTLSPNPRVRPIGSGSSGLKIVGLPPQAWLLFPSAGTKYALRATQNHWVYFPCFLCNDQFLLFLLFSVLPPLFTLKWYGVRDSLPPEMNFRMSSGLCFQITNALLS